MTEFSEILANMYGTQGAEHLPSVDSPQRCRRIALIGVSLMEAFGEVSVATPFQEGFLSQFQTYFTGELRFARPAILLATEISNHILGPSLIK
jgi:hypothetical protein